MTLFKRLISICLFCIFAATAMAQYGTNSPYTRYGFGQLSDQSFGNSKAMGGIAYGLRNGLHINAANPASYSAVDSLTFLFDAGMSYAISQIIDLLVSDIDGIHLYTMNNPVVARRICEGIKNII